MVRPCCLNRPRCSATKKPAESTAGTTATLSVVFCSPIGLVLPAVAARLPQPERAIRAIARGGARIVKQDEFMNLPFKGNSDISCVELPVLILVTEFCKAGKWVPCDQGDR